MNPERKKSTRFAESGAGIAVVELPAPTFRQTVEGAMGRIKAVILAAAAEGDDYAVAVAEDALDCIGSLRSVAR